MSSAPRPFGSAALLRVAGLPASTWLAAAAPDLVARVELLVDAEDGLRGAARDLAERVGADLVTDPAVSRDERRALLDLRRRLHRGDPVGGTDPRTLPSTTTTPAAGTTLRALVAHLGAERAVGVLATRLAADVTAESERLARLPAELRAGSAVARAVVPASLLPATSGATTRGDRRRAAHARRLLARASTVATPRGWFSHVGLVDVADGSPGRDVTGPIVGPTPTLGPTLTVGRSYAAHWTQDVRDVRRPATAPPEDWPDPPTPLALNPLQWTDGDRLVSVVLDHHEQPVHAVVRTTPLLEAVRTVLHDGPRTAADLAAALGCTDAEEREGLRGFVRHLVGLGVLQAGSTPGTALVVGARPEATVDARPGWVDVHRDVVGTPARGDVVGLQPAVLEALAVLDLAADASSTDPAAEVTAALPDGTWTLADVLATELDVDPDADAQPAPAADPTPGRPSRPPATTRLADLLRRAAAATPPGAPVVLDRERLARAGVAVPATLPWPVDCLVRLPGPGAAHPPVLEQVWPPGVLDSRFVHGITAVQGSPPHDELGHVAGYRAFLRRLEELTGTLVVELLAPPLSDGAANAVRRPAYASAWTGDPHAALYTGASGGRYVPLGEIRLERRAGRLTAWAGDRQLWPTYHATRSLSPPWDRVAQVLLAAAPVPARGARDLLAVVTVPDGMTSLPRVEVSGGLVLAPAQWLVEPTELWRPDDAPDVRLRALVRLRRDRGLPRWVWLVPPGDDPAAACDLMSLDALDTLDRRTTSVARLVEMLPRPDALAVHDAAHDGQGVISQLHLRFPVDETPHGLAERLMRAGASGRAEPSGHATAHRTAPITATRTTHDGSTPAPVRSRGPPRTTSSTTVPAPAGPSSRTPRPTTIPSARSTR